MTVLEHPENDERLLNEVFGFFVRCGTQAAAHLTDYVVTLGTATIIGGARVTTLLAVCEFTGLMARQELDGATVWKLVDDVPDFLHLRLKRDIDWERQRKADANRPSLVVPVRLRDGDGCRWCGKVVDWNDRRSGRSGTYDHLDPGEPATVDTYVVCCKTCNSSRQEGVMPAGVTGLLDPPDEPIFSTVSIRWLTENRWRADNGFPVPSATSPDTLSQLVRGSRPRQDRANSPEIPDGSSKRRASSVGTPGMTAAQSTAPSATPTSKTPNKAAATTRSADPTPGMAAARSAGSPDQAARPRSADPNPGMAAARAPITDEHPAAADPTPTINPKLTVAGAESATAEPPPGDTRSAGNQLDRTDRRGTRPAVSGRDGSGRAGTGSESSPPTHHHSQRQSRNRRRGGRGGRSRPKD
ncbi:hypothetical protein [Gordonia malaquae]|uniref:hypothetical protein n=1 Tax=Gordonia malaquae TaxID=410332 RepID=UPI003015FC77